MAQNESFAVLRSFKANSYRIFGRLYAQTVSESLKHIDFDGGGGEGGGGYLRESDIISTRRPDVSWLYRKNRTQPGFIFGSQEFTKIWRKISFYCLF